MESFSGSVLVLRKPEQEYNSQNHITIDSALAAGIFFSLFSINNK